MRDMKKLSNIVIETPEGWKRLSTEEARKRHEGLSADGR